MHALRSLARCAASQASREFSTSHPAQAKIICALYEGYEAGATNPNIFGCVENGLGLRDWAAENGHELIVTSSKDGPDSVLESHLHDAEVVISQPFWPAYITRERIAKAPKLKLALTAGVGSDHVDLEAACERHVDVVEITGCNVVSVAEHVVMQILALVRNYIPAYHQVVNGEWKIANIADRAYDLEGKSIGTVAAGRIGYRVLQRLKPFDVRLHYQDKFRLPPWQEQELNCEYHETVEEMVKHCDIITINCPLHPETEHMFNADLIAKMKPGSYIVNTARGKIVDRDALVAAVESGHISGYAGDVWFPQPAPADHPWRQMPRHAMTPHYSGTTLDAQARYAAGVKYVLDCHFNGKPIREDYLIVKDGAVASRAYTKGDATKGSA